MVRKIKRIQALTLVVMLTVSNTSPVMAAPVSAESINKTPNNTSASNRHNTNSKPSSSSTAPPDSDVQQSPSNTPPLSNAGSVTNPPMPAVVNYNGKTIEALNKKFYSLIAALAIFLFLLLGGFFILFKRGSENQADIKRLREEINKKIINAKKTENSIVKQEAISLSNIIHRLDIMESNHQNLLDKIAALELKLTETLKTPADIAVKNPSNLEALPMLTGRPVNEMQKKPIKLTDEEVIRRVFEKIQAYIQSPEKQNITGKQVQEAIKQSLGKAVSDVFPLNSSLDYLTLSKNYEALRIDLSALVAPLHSGANSLLFVRQDTLQDTKLSLLFDGLPLGGCVKDLHSPTQLKLDASQMGQVCNITESMAVVKGQVSSL